LGRLATAQAAPIRSAPFISNPDLPERIRAGAPLAPWNLETFYSPGAPGYTDYPSLALSPA
jgi:N-ethylmaleimide reductase